MQLFSYNPVTKVNYEVHMKQLLGTVVPVSASLCVVAAVKGVALVDRRTGRSHPHLFPRAATASASVRRLATRKQCVCHCTACTSMSLLHCERSLHDDPPTPVFHLFSDVFVFRATHMHVLPGEPKQFLGPNPEAASFTLRWNDGKCDPQGRLWVGSMDMQFGEKWLTKVCGHSNLVFSPVAIVYPIVRPFAPSPLQLSVM